MSRMLYLVPLLTGALLCSGQTMQMDNADDHRPVPLVAGLGNAHHPIRTVSPEAQKFFDQGIDYLYAFNHDEARRSFQKASSLDPDAAMPLWGFALAVGPNYNDIDIGSERAKQAFAAISRAVPLAAAGPAVEKDYIAALAVRYAPDANHELKTMSVAYSAAMAGLMAKYPDDLDAATLYAESLMDLHPWQLWTAAGEPAEGTLEIVATLKSVLARDPQHVGANHLFIHAVEASKDPSSGLPSARRLETLAPAAGHLVHMPAHIYQRVGDFNAGAEANERAVAADRAYFQSQHLEGVANMYNGMYYTHNMHFMASSCSMEGNLACTQKAAAQLVENVLPQVAGNRVVEWFLPTQPWMMVRFAQWDAILKAPPPPQGMFILNAMWHYARGSAYTGLGKLGQAAAERNALADASGSLPADVQPDFNNPARAAMGLALTALDARLCEARGDRAQAIALWSKAVDQYDAFAYNEPSDWYYPVRESLGGALLRNGQAAEAEKVFRRDLQQNPRNGRSLFGLWQSLAMQKKNTDAAWIQTEFEDSWKHADVTLHLADL